MNEITLQANIRKSLGHSAANELRRSGRVPGVFYLHNEINIPVEVRSLDLRPLVYTSDTHIVNLKLDDGNEHHCVIRDVQFDPVSDDVIHFDLMGLVAGVKMRVEVPIVLEGNALGVREGGLLNHILHKVEVECLPKDLPEHITVDVTNLGLGDIIHVGGLQTENFTILMDADVPVLTISHARVTEEVAPPVEGLEPEEPEVISRGGAEEEE